MVPSLGTANPEAPTKGPKYPQGGILVFVEGSFASARGSGLRKPT